MHDPSASPSIMYDTVQEAIPCQYLSSENRLRVTERHPFPPWPVSVIDSNIKVIIPRCLSNYNI